MIAAQGEPTSYPMVEDDALDVDPVYRDLQQKGPIQVRLPHGEPGWLATSYDDVRTVFGDRRFGRAIGLEHDAPGMFPSALVKDPTLLVNMDPPDHTRIRRLTSTAFAPARVAGMSTDVQRMVDDLLDAMAAQGPSVDFVEAFASQLPVQVLLGILGVSQDKSTSFRGLIDEMTSHHAEAESRAKAKEELYAYIRGLIEERRAQRTDDLLGTLVQARDDDDRLSEDELLSLCVALWSGGFKTTLMQLGTTLYALMTHRSHWDELVADPELVPAACEELWRWIPSFRYGFPFVRWASEDVELSGGVTVRAGEPVLPEFSVANRDESVFPNGWDLDFHRDKPRPHLSLAFGPHYCMGAHVAQLQVRLAVDSLVRRFPAMELAVPASDIQWSNASLMRAVEALPVTW